MARLLALAAPYLLGGTVVMGMGCAAVVWWLASTLDDERRQHADTKGALSAANQRIEDANAAVRYSDTLRIQEANNAADTIANERARLATIEAAIQDANISDSRLRQAVREQMEKNDALNDLLLRELPGDFLRIHCAAARERGAATPLICDDLLSAPGDGTESAVHP